MKYKRAETSKAGLQRMVQQLFKKNLELLRELHPYREFKKAITENFPK
jgi:hypothetical protein